MCSRCATTTGPWKGVKIITTGDATEQRPLATTFSLIYAITGEPVVCSEKPLVIAEPPCSWSRARTLVKNFFAFDVGDAYFDDNGTWRCRLKVFMRNQALCPWDILTADDDSGHVQLLLFKTNSDAQAQSQSTATRGPREIAVLLCEPCHAVEQMARRS